MKTELREVTTTKEVYIADDGTEFEDDDECEAYEMDCLAKTIKFYSHDLDESDLDQCTYMKCMTQTAFDNVLKLCDYQGLTTEGLCGPGIYMYQGISDKWVNLNDLITAIQDE